MSKFKVEVGEMKERVNLVYCMWLSIPLGYYVPWMNWLAWIMVVGVIGFMFGGGLMLLIKNNEFRHKLKMAGVPIHTPKLRAWWVIVYGTAACGMVYYGWPIATLLYGISLVFWHIALNRAMR